jgi:hypothetical protein
VLAKANARVSNLEPLADRYLGLLAIREVKRVFRDHLADGNAVVQTRVEQPVRNQDVAACLPTGSFRGF